MSTCFNCRASVAAGRLTCPRCGRWARGGGPYSPRDDLSPRAEGWGLPTYITQGAAFRWTSLLAPIWLQPLVMVWLQAPPVLVAFVLALFIYIPGLYVVTNLPRLAGWVKVIASLGYVAVSGALGLASMVLVHGLLHG